MKEINKNSLLDLIGIVINKEAKELKKHKKELEK